MAKVPFTKLGLTKNIDIKIIEFNNQQIEIKQYLPLGEKIELIDNVLNNVQETNNFINTVMLETLIDLNIIFKYTNISFTEKQKEDLYKLYDLLFNSGLKDAIYEAIPTNEIEQIYHWSYTIAKNFYEYRNSAYGIIETISQDKDKLDFDATEIQKALANGENIELLKEILTKMG